MTEKDCSLDIDGDKNGYHRPCERSIARHWLAQNQQLQDCKIGPLPLPAYIALALLTISAASVGRLPNDMIGGLAVMMLAAFLLAEIGNRIPVFKNIGKGLSMEKAPEQYPSNALQASQATLTEKMFPGFEKVTVATSGTTINTLVGGQGPALLLLHGHPQTMACWHKVAPALARHFTVVLTDLRGYGDSGKPDGGANHIGYSKRLMALDQVEVMRHLGFSRFQVAAHDRGARVAHRMLLDHPQAVERAAILDIAPTATMYAGTNMEFATRYVWWFFLIQPAPMPERLIGADPEFYLKHHIDKQNKTPGAITPDAYAEYRRCYTAQTVHAVCEDYRAAASIDLEHDAADAEKKIQSPLLVLWGDKGVVGNTYDVLKTWREKSVDGAVQGGSLPCGHYLPEEAAEKTLSEFMQFFRAA